MTRQALLLARLSRRHRRERIETLGVLGLCVLAGAWAVLWVAVR